LLPIIVFVYIGFPQLYELAAGATSVLVVAGFITALAHFVRYRGRSIEDDLFSSWGGKPTTVLLRHSDPTIDTVTKKRYHAYLSENINCWSAPAVDEEEKNPVGADEVYESAGKWLLESTRDTKIYSLLFKENISYGFRRNCYGIKWHACLLSLLPLSLVLINYGYSGEVWSQTKIIIMAASAIFSVALFVWWGFVVSPKWVKDAAISYSIRLLASCDTAPPNT